MGSSDENVCQLKTQKKKKDPERGMFVQEIRKKDSLNAFIADI